MTASLLISWAGLWLLEAEATAPRSEPFTCPPVRGRIEAGERAPSDLVPPEKTNDVSPVYPATARDAKMQGRVVLATSVKTDGTLRNPRVVKGLDPDLDAAALDAVKQWRYTPALFRGRPCESPLTITIRFTLDSSETKPDGPADSSAKPSTGEPK